MSTEGFNNEIGVDLATGFVYGSSLRAPILGFVEFQTAFPSPVCSQEVINTTVALGWTRWGAPKRLASKANRQPRGKTICMCSNRPSNLDVLSFFFIHIPFLSHSSSFLSHSYPILIPFFFILIPFLSILISLVILVGIVFSDGSAVELVALCKSTVTWLSAMYHKGLYPNDRVTWRDSGMAMMRYVIILIFFIIVSCLLLINIPYLPK